MILGDMNAHLELLEDRKKDINGEMIREWMNEEDLILLNGEEKCTGVYTWGRYLGEDREQKSAIDMVLVNSNLYKKYREMEIDENRDVFRFSDHNLITIGVGTDLIRRNMRASLTIRKTKNP